MRDEKTLKVRSWYLKGGFELRENYLIIRYGKKEYGIPLNEGDVFVEIEELPDDLDYKQLLEFILTALLTKGRKPQTTQK